MRAPARSFALAVVACVLAVAVGVWISATTVPGRPVGWRAVLLGAFVVLACVFAVRGALALGRSFQRQVRWGDTVVVGADAPDDFHPGATGTVREITYNSGIRMVEVAFEDGSSGAVPERFLEREGESTKPWNVK